MSISILEFEVQIEEAAVRLVELTDRRLRHSMVLDLEESDVDTGSAQSVAPFGLGRDVSVLHG